MDHTDHPTIGALLPRLRNFALGLTGSQAEADDLVQAACLKALSSASPPSPGSRLDSWMYRIIQNQWIDWRRTAARCGPHLALADVQESELAATGTDTVEMRSSLVRVGAAIRTLPPAQRVVMELTCLAGLSYRECADRLSLPEGTVMSRLARARQSLVRRLEADPLGI